MNYKEKYEEAFKKAKDLHDNHALGMPFIYETCEQIFPELRESKDEKIRKELIRAFTVTADKRDYEIYGNGITYGQVLAWLEKQGENQSVEGTFINVDDVRDGFMSEVYRVLDADTTNDRSNQIIQAFDSLPTVTIKRQSEQNPSWSKEDELNFNQAIYVCHQHGYSGVEIWLKSFKERMKGE